MFSTTTTASSMTRPIATARPPSDIRLSESPNNVKAGEGPDDRQRKGERRRDGNDGPVQEEQQHDDGEHATYQHGVRTLAIESRTSAP